jgi:hypothetical protein
MVGCAGPAPNYSPSIANVELLKKEGLETMRVGQVGAMSGMSGAESMSLRANSMVSPVGSNYGDYLAAALRQELDLAKLLNPRSDVEVSGVLVKNNIDAGGISTSEGQIEARFIVKRLDQIKYDKVKKAEHKWDSSFVGGVAIPLAVNNYPVMVQKLLNGLFSDSDFIAATKK